MPDARFMRICLLFLRIKARGHLPAGARGRPLNARHRTKIQAALMPSANSLSYVVSRSSANMKILITADLHFRELWFRWLFEQAPDFDL